MGKPDQPAAGVVPNPAWEERVQLIVRINALRGVGVDDPAADALRAGCERDLRAFAAGASPEALADVLLYTLGTREAYLDGGTDAVTRLLLQVGANPVPVWRDIEIVLLDDHSDNKNELWMLLNAAAANHALRANQPWAATSLEGKERIAADTVMQRRFKENPLDPLACFYFANLKADEVGDGENWSDRSLADAGKVVTTRHGSSVLSVSMDFIDNNDCEERVRSAIRALPTKSYVSVAPGDQGKPKFRAVSDVVPAAPNEPSWFIEVDIDTEYENTGAKLTVWVGEPDALAAHRLTVLSTLQATLVANQIDFVCDSLAKANRALDDIGTLADTSMSASARRKLTRAYKKLDSLLATNHALRVGNKASVATRVAPPSTPAQSDKPILTGKPRP